MSDKTGRQEIFVISKTEEGAVWGVPRQLTFEGGQYPRWSPEGGLIAYTYGTSLQVISLEGGDPKVLVNSQDPDAMPVPRFPEWSSDGQTVYYKAFNADGKSSFWSVPAEGGKPKLLVRFDDPLRKSLRIEYTTDGSNFFFTLTDNQSDIWVMDLIYEEK
jgi:Tol biopolymer transport system component